MSTYPRRNLVIPAWTTKADTYRANVDGRLGVARELPLLPEPGRAASVHAVVDIRVGVEACQTVLVNLDIAFRHG